MGKAYSQDLREQVMAAVDSGTGAIRNRQDLTENHAAAEFAALAGDIGVRLAEVRLRLSWAMAQRNKHLARPQ